MDAGRERAAGFSTVEMLVAFVVLSLGLGLAIQNVSQAGLSLKHASRSEREVFLVDQLISEELPRLIARFEGAPIEANGASWQIRVEQLSSDGDRGLAHALVRLGSNGSSTEPTVYSTVVPVPRISSNQP